MEHCKKYNKIHKKQIEEYSKKYRVTHKKERKMWLINNKKKIKKQMAVYYCKHKKEIDIYRNKYRKDRRKKDIQYKIKCYLRTRIWEALKGNPKLKTTMELTGCSIKQLKLHLEKQFTEGMLWKNYGKWHVDHIKPCKFL